MPKDLDHNLPHSWDYGNVPPCLIYLDGVSLTFFFCPGWSQNIILPIVASSVAGVTGVTAPGQVYF
jgi:hypothetical protein